MRWIYGEGENSSDDLEDVVKLIISAGFDLSDSSPLWPLSSDFECDKVVSLLLRAGMKVEGLNDEGETPLHGAAREDCCATMEVLLNAGVDATQVDYSGNTALHHTAFRLESDMSLKLIDAGVDVSVRNRNGETALDRLILGLQMEMVDGLNRGNESDALMVLKALVKARADVHTKNKAGKTPLQSIVEHGLAQEWHFDYLKQWVSPLLSVGAQPGKWLQSIADNMTHEEKELLTQSYEKATSPRAEIIREWLDEQAESYMPADLQGLIGEFDGAPVSIQQVDKSLQQIKAYLGQSEQDEGPRRKKRRLN